MLLLKKHLRGQQSTRERGEESTLQTKGRTITWAWLYDYVVGFLRVPASAANGSEDGKCGPEQPVADRCGELGGQL